MKNPTFLKRSLRERREIESIDQQINLIGHSTISSRPVKISTAVLILRRMAEDPVNNVHLVRLLMKVRNRKIALFPHSLFSCGGVDTSTPMWIFFSWGAKLRLFLICENHVPHLKSQHYVAPGPLKTKKFSTCVEPR